MASERVTLLRLSGKGARCLLHLSDGRTLAAAADYLREHGLHEGLALEPAQWDELAAAMARHACQRQAARLLNLRPHTALELRLKLRRKGHDPMLIEQLLAKLTDHGLVDDARFAQLYSEERLRWAKVGRQRVAGELRQRGVARETVRETLAASASPEAVDLERQAAMTLAERKWRALSRGEPDERRRRQKLLRFLAARGYSAELCRQALEALQQTPSDDELPEA